MNSIKNKKKKYKFGTEYLKTHVNIVVWNRIFENLREYDKFEPPSSTCPNFETHKKFVRTFFCICISLYKYSV